MAKITNAELLARWNKKPVFEFSIPVLSECLIHSGKDFVGYDLDFCFVPSEVKKLQPIENLAPVPSKDSSPFHTPGHESFALSIKLDEYQIQAVERAKKGQCFVMIGPAGCGKTTSQREIARVLWKSGLLKTHNFKDGAAPSFAAVAYTNVATGNLRKAIVKDPELKIQFVNNILTIHKLLEFEPEFYDVLDEKTGEYRTTMRFVPRRNASNPLQITHLVVEEASMLDIPLWNKLYDALLPGTQIIFIGDINQLQPIFGPSVLNYALVQLPVVELKNVYRQAENSAILDNAHRILRGEPLAPDGDQFQLIQTEKGGKIPKVHTTQMKIIRGLEKAWHNGRYDPEQDIILSPFNKHELGTISLNNHIAHFLDEKKREEDPKFKVYEVIAGMRKLYLAVGDKVLVNKQDGIITKIRPNMAYFGKSPKLPSHNLTRFGIEKVSSHEEFDLEESESGPDYTNLDVDVQDEERKNKASHCVEIVLETGEVVVLDAAGEFADQVFQLGYCLTVHKAQGREWRKVYIVLHNQHAVMLHRELLYTAVTRAREQCIVLDWCNKANKMIQNPRINGNSLEAKIEYFNSKVALDIPVNLIP